MTLSDSDFVQLNTSFEACINACPDLLATSYFDVDDRHGCNAGYVRKEQKINVAGRQTEDPKSIIHFTETARERWRDQYQWAPKILHQFFAEGFEIQNNLVAQAKTHIAALSETHPNMTELYFPPEGPESLSFMRVLSYDSYDVHAQGSYAPVAKPHFDIGGVTIQAYADAAGFWGAKDGPFPDAHKLYYDTEPNTAYMF